MKLMNKNTILDDESRTLYVVMEDKWYPLTVMECRILSIIMKAKKPIPLKQLVESYYEGNGEFVYTKEHVLMNAISKMRCKVPWLKDHLITIPKHGYLLKEEQSTVSNEDAVLLKVNKKSLDVLEALFEKLKEVLDKSENATLIVSYSVEHVGGLL